MKTFKKPTFKIVDLKNIDVITLSGRPVGTLHQGGGEFKADDFGFWFTSYPHEEIRGDIFKI